VSTTAASAAFFLTDSMPFLALALAAYVSDAAMISPLPALSRKRYLPALSFVISNFASHVRSLRRVDVVRT
jgi:hypothetical protein